MSMITWWSSLRMHWRPMCVLSMHMPSWASATLSESNDLAFSTAAELLERGLELAPVRLAHRVVGVEDVDLLAHLVDDVLGQAGGLHARVGLVREVVLVELRGAHELGARDRVPVDRLVLLGDVHHRQGRAARDGADQQLHVVLQDELLGLAHRRRGLGLVVLGDDLDLVAQDAALDVELLDRHLHAPRLVLAVALEDAHLRAEVADLDDLLLRDGRRRDPDLRGQRDQQGESPRHALHEFLLGVVDGGVVDDASIRVERACAIRRSGTRMPAGSAGAAPPAAGLTKASASSNARRTATEALLSRVATAKSTRL